MALPKDVSGQRVLGKLIGDGKALLDRASDAGWPELNAFSERFHRYIRVFDKLLPEEASKIKTFTFIRFLDYDDSSDEDRDGLSKHADGGWQNETDCRWAVRDFDFGQIRIAVDWLLVLAEKLRLLPREPSTSEPELSQEISEIELQMTTGLIGGGEPPPEGGFVKMAAGPAVNWLIGNEADQCGGDKPGNEVITPAKAEPSDATAGGGSGSSLIPQFPNRALWLKDRFHERSWNKHDLWKQGGPHHKTVQKILDGLPVREDVLEKVATALSTKYQKVTAVDIPQT